MRMPRSLRSSIASAITLRTSRGEHRQPQPPVERRAHERVGVLDRGRLGRDHDDAVVAHHEVVHHRGVGARAEVDEHEVGGERAQRAHEAHAQRVRGLRVGEVRARGGDQAQVRERRVLEQLAHVLLALGGELGDAVARPRHAERRCGDWRPRGRRRQRPRGGRPCASAVARFAARKVLPTPPLPPPNGIRRGTPFTGGPSLVPVITSHPLGLAAPDLLPAAPPGAALANHPPAATPGPAPRCEERPPLFVANLRADVCEHRRPARLAPGAGRRRSRACAGVRPPLRRLQSMQLHTTFSHVVRPPSERGITWSRLSFERCGLPPQY